MFVPLLQIVKELGRKNTSKLKDGPAGEFIHKVGHNFMVKQEDVDRVKEILSTKRFSESQAAKYLGVTPGILCRLRAQKAGPKYFPTGSDKHTVYWYYQSDLDEWVPAS